MDNKENILIVDDCNDAAALIAFYVERVGHNAIQVNNGFEGIRLLEQQPISLVLLDLSMPEIGGFETLEKMREIRRLIELPILMVTSSRDADGIVRALQLGANDYVNKPVNMAVLTARINAHLSRRKVFLELLNTKNELDAQFEKQQESEALMQKYCIASTEVARGSFLKHLDAVSDLLVKSFEARQPLRPGIVGTITRNMDVICNDGMRLGFSVISEHAEKIKAEIAEMASVANGEKTRGFDAIEPMLEALRKKLFAMSPTDSTLYKDDLEMDIENIAC